MTPIGAHTPHGNHELPWAGRDRLGSKLQARLRLISGDRHFILVPRLTAKRLLKRGQLRFDVAFELAPFDDVLPIAAEEVIDGLDANANRAGRLVLVEVLERKIRCARLFNDAFDNSVNGSIVTALEAGYFERDKIRMTGSKLRHSVSDKMPRSGIRNQADRSFTQLGLKPISMKRSRQHAKRGYIPCPTIDYAYESVQ
jgi:hypothetical protein